jgi:adenylate cyclase, class 2
LLETLGHLSNTPEHRLIRHMHNQRIPAGPLFRFEYFRHGRGIQSIRAQPVHGLRWERDRAARAKQLCRPRDCAGRRNAFGLQPFSFHGRGLSSRLFFFIRHYVFAWPYTHPMQNAEIELKFPIDDLAQLQSYLPLLGFQLDTPRTFEQNTLYDTPGRSLRLSRQILRIRRYGDIWTATHKRMPDGCDGEETRYKIRIETETRVEDGPALAIMFEQIGYAPMFRYEKFRTEWSQSTPCIQGPLFNNPDLPAEISQIPPRSHLVLDETPIGDFAELEGPPVWIDKTLASLGIDPATCLTDSYGRLFLAWKERTGSPAENLTFDEIPSASASLVGAR